MQGLLALSNQCIKYTRLGADHALVTRKQLIEKPTLTYSTSQYSRSECYIATKSENLKMVRVISNSFTTPRSRHSSGEVLVDQMTAEKAVTALNYTGHRSRFSPYPTDRDEMHMEVNCDTDSSTNDSFSGGESDLEKRGDANLSEEALEMVMTEGDAMKEKIRKMRRRERNKVSAQAYRQRRREQNNIAQKMLDALEANHKMLLEKVRHLEAEKHIVEEYLKTCVKIPWCPHHISCPPSTFTGTPTGKTVTGNITSCRGLSGAMETGSSAS